MSKAFNSGRKQGKKGDVIGNFFHSVGNTVTGNMAGSKTQKAFNDGHRRGQQDRKQGGNNRNR